ncbi:MAG TPA: cyanophycin synthetase [Patescibacteria group bacterium]
MIPYRFIHFVGALSPDVAALAVYTAQSGIKVTASDDHNDNLYAPALQAAGVEFFDMFAQTNIQKTTELVVLSPYYDDKHIEAVVALNAKIRVITAIDYAKLLSEQAQRLAIVSDYEGPIIATLLAHVWNQAYMPIRGLTKTITVENPSLSVVNEADWFVHPLSGFKRDATTYEADFLSLEAQTVIIPSIMYDYPELNTTLDEVYQSYYTFVKRIPRKGLIIGNSDWSRMKRLRTHLADRHIETYGFDRDAMWQIRDVTTENGSTSFSLFSNRHLYGPFTIPYCGTLYTYAAAAVCVASLTVDMKPEVLGRGLLSAPKLKRYFEQHTDKEGRALIVDRADHPELIHSVLETVKALYPDKRIWCVYQPGSFLRTKALSDDLEQALKLADSVYLADITGYPREKSEGLHIRHFIAHMKATHPQTYYSDESVDIAQLLSDRVPSSDCIVVLGAETLIDHVLNHLLPQGEE